MKPIRKLALLLMALLMAVSLFTACDAISSEDADALLSLAGEVINEYAETGSAGDAISTAVGSAIDTAKDGLSDTVKSNLEDAVDVAKDAVTGAVEDIAGSAADTVKSAVDNAVDAAADKVKSAVDGAVDTAKDAVTDAVDSAATAAKEAVKGDKSGEQAEATSDAGDEDGVAYGQPYYDKDSVAAYLHEYGELPPNYLTKKEAQAKGWESSKGNLWKVTEKGCIGGDYFGNYEGKLPTAKGRKYYECDVNYSGGNRGRERLIYSNDGLIYYTGDHYNTFTLLYGEE